MCRIAGLYLTFSSSFFLSSWYQKKERKKNEISMENRAGNIETDVEVVHLSRMPAPLIRLNSYQSFHPSRFITLHQWFCCSVAPVVVFADLLLLLQVISFGVKWLPSSRYGSSWPPRLSSPNPFITPVNLHFFLFNYFVPVGLPNPFGRWEGEE